MNKNYPNARFYIDSGEILDNGFFLGSQQVVVDILNKQDGQIQSLKSRWEKLKEFINEKYKDDEPTENERITLDEDYFSKRDHQYVEKLILNKMTDLEKERNMNKAILISIRPEFVEKILNSEKTIEIRKTKPSCELPVKVYIYETKGLFGTFYTTSNPVLTVPNGGHVEKVRNGEYKVWYRSKGRGKVVAEFTLNEVYKYGCGLNPTNVLERACITFDELVEYQNYKPFRKPYDYLDFYAWHISDLKIYDKPKELSEFKSWKYECDGWNWETGKKEKGYMLAPLSRPPQSYCFVEELED